MKMLGCWSDSSCFKFGEKETVIANKKETPCYRPELSAADRGAMAMPALLLERGDFQVDRQGPGMTSDESQGYGEHSPCHPGGSGRLDTSA